MFSRKQRCTSYLQAVFNFFCIIVLNVGLMLSAHRCTVGLVYVSQDVECIGYVEVNNRKNAILHLHWYIVISKRHLQRTDIRLLHFNNKKTCQNYVNVGTPLAAWWRRKLIAKTNFYPVFKHLNWVNLPCVQNFTVI